ncbi:cullin-like protein-like protein [Leishmania donovani]|uniref:Cullin family protein n=1 Tax=Leishmania donovani TaxID=5661 RepID=E9BH99_LEIDO|nr:cullin-like protein-like protein [Leishmania donovani]TPP52357.1 Cullin family protein [Leishmania donovani]CBZ34625.1 cullin-like protein-like protein [Leishmania donovani]
MLEEDRQALRKMKADFETLADLANSDFQGYNTFERRMNHYNTVYTAATRNTSKAAEYPGYDAGELLYMEYNEMLTTYLWRYRDLSGDSEQELFQKILDVWDHYKILMKWNMRTFGYLSRYYIVYHSKPSLQQVGLSIFLEQVFKKNADVVSSITQKLLLKERADRVVSTDAKQISTAIGLFSSMNIEDTQSIYLTAFLEPYLDKTKRDYERFLQEWDAVADAAVFLRSVHDALTHERSICRRYFSTQDEERIMTCVEATLVDSPVTRRKLVDSPSGVRAMLRSRDEAQLKMCNSFFSRRQSGIALLAGLIKKEIETEGLELCERFKGEEASVDVVAYTTGMMHLQEVYPQLLSRCFQLEFTLSKAVREGLEACYNHGVAVTSSCGGGESRIVPFCEWLSHYVNHLFQHEAGPASVEMDRIVATLAYVTERDRFIATSREHMADRILLPVKKFSEANERALIQRFRQRCGPTSTACLESMLHDWETSNSFRAMEVLASKNVPMTFEVELLVAKKGIWPSRLSDEPDIVVPPFLQRVLEPLRDEYLSGKSGRVLTWSHECSSGELQGSFKKGTQLFFACGIQVLILLCFNSSPVCTPQQIGDRCHATFASLQRYLPPLIRSRILTRKSGKALLQMDDELTVNDDFVCRARRMRIPPSLARVSVGESEHISKQVEEDRKPAIDGALVRIMKGRRSLDHAELVLECQQQLSSRFLPDVKLIKQRIEELIRREYISRDPRSKGVYHYIA